MTAGDRDSETGRLTDAVRGNIDTEVNKYRQRDRQTKIGIQRRWNPDAESNTVSIHLAAGGLKLKAIHLY